MRNGKIVKLDRKGIGRIRGRVRATSATEVQVPTHQGDVNEEFITEIIREAAQPYDLRSEVARRRGKIQRALGEINGVIKNYQKYHQNTMCQIFLSKSSTN